MVRYTIYVGLFSVKNNNCDVQICDVGIKKNKPLGTGARGGFTYMKRYHV